MQKAKFLSLNWKDAIHGILVAFLGSLTYSVYDLLNSGKLPTTWADFKPILVSALVFTIGYIIKNFFSNSAGNFAQSEQKAPTIYSVPKPEANTDITVQQTITPKSNQ